MRVTGKSSLILRKLENQSKKSSSANLYQDSAVEKAEGRHAKNPHTGKFDHSSTPPKKERKEISSEYSLEKEFKRTILHHAFVKP